MTAKLIDLKKKANDAKFIAVAKAILATGKEFVNAADIQLTLEYPEEDLNTMQIGQVLATRYRAHPGLLKRQRLEKTNALGGSYLYGINEAAFQAFLDGYNAKIKKVG